MHNDGDKKPVIKNLLFSGIGIHLQVNFFVQLFLFLLNPEKMDQVKVQK
jgi:hypothetical protein